MVIVPISVIGLPETETSVPNSSVSTATLVTVPVQSVLLLNVVQSALDKAPLFVELAVGKLNVISPEPVIGLPVTLKSFPVVPVTAPTLVTVPTQSVLELNVVQSVDVNLPVFVALDSGIDMVIVPTSVIGLPETETSVPNSSVTTATLFTVPSAPILDIVIVSVVSFVVIVIPVPSSNVTESLLLSATIVFWPDTQIFLNIFCAEPLSVFVTVIVPDAVIGLPDIDKPPPFERDILETVPVQVVKPASLLKPVRFIFDLFNFVWTPEASTTAK